MRHLQWFAVAAIATMACNNAGEQITTPGYYTGSFNVHFYLDADGDGVRSDDDPTVPGVKVALFSATGSDTLSTGVSNELGRVQFVDLPLGGYRFSIVHSTIGDSLVLTGADTSGVRLLARLDSLTDLREVILSYPTVTAAEAKASAPGKRVIVRGKVLAPPQSFHENQAYIADASGAIRITGATTFDGTTALAIGDSVMVTGTTGTNLGRAVIIDGVLRPFGNKPAPIARVTSVTEARTANDGALDAALVQVSGVKVGDTTMVNPDYQVTLVSASDPADQVVVVIDQLIEVVHANFSAGRNIVVRGVLTPKGDGTWVIRPRSLQDITFP